MWILQIIIMCDQIWHSSINAFMYWIMKKDILKAEFTRFFNADKDKTDLAIFVWVINHKYTRSSKDLVSQIYLKQ